MRLALAVAALLWLPAAASADAGPPLTLPEEQLRSALTCTGEGPTVLLVHGTFTSGEPSWGRTYVPTLVREGKRACVLAIPDRELGDTRINAEYVVHAVRSLRGDGRIDTIGHSQGTMVQRWAARWWPDVAASVDDMVSLSGPLTGSAAASAICTGPCPPWAHFAGEGSTFMTSLNAPAMAPRVLDATSIYTDYDELVQPTSISVYEPAPNTSTVRLQEVCPGRAVEHGLMVADAAVYAIVRDALDNPGPADPSRVAEPCPPGNLEGVDSFAFGAELVSELTAGSAEVCSRGGCGPNTLEEPPAADYTLADPPVFGTLELERLDARRVRVTLGGAPARRVRVRAGKRRARTGARGIARIGKARHVTARLPGYVSASS